MSLSDEQFDEIVAKEYETLNRRERRLVEKKRKMMKVAMAVPRYATVSVKQNTFGGGSMGNNGGTTGNGGVF